MGRYFGTDGIRGKAGVTLLDETVYRIGKFLGNYYPNGKIVIGMDTRESSKGFLDDLVKGVTESGSDVYAIGYCSTPCLMYITMEEDFDCGIIISASHNPYTDNGIKVISGKGTKMEEETLALIEDYIDNPVGIEITAKGKLIDYSNAIKTYQNWLLKNYSLDLKGMKIVADLANGSNCYTAKDVFDKLNLDVTYINNEPNGININNHCGSTHLEMLMDTVKKGNYDLGLAFDGDADRVLMVDEDGELFDGDKIMYLIAKYLKDNKILHNNTLVTTVMSNIGLFKSIEKLNIDCDITPVGDKNVTESMMKNDFSVGGEQSGHIIYAGDCYFGDGLKTALLIFKCLKYYGVSLKEISKEVNIYPQLLVNETVKDKNIVLNDEDIKNLIDDISKRLKDNGRILVRPSGTEPLIRVMVEAANDEICHDLVYEVIDLIKLKGYAL